MTWMENNFRLSGKSQIQLKLYNGSIYSRFTRFELHTLVLRISHESAVGSKHKIEATEEYLYLSCLRLFLN